MRNRGNFPFNERARLAPFRRAVNSVRLRLRRSALVLRRRLLPSRPLIAAEQTSYRINNQNAAASRLEAAFFVDSFGERR